MNPANTLFIVDDPGRPIVQCWWPLPTDCSLLMTPADPLDSFVHRAALTANVSPLTTKNRFKNIGFNLYLTKSWYVHAQVTISSNYVSGPGTDRHTLDNQPHCGVSLFTRKRGNNIESCLKSDFGRFWQNLQSGASSQAKHVGAYFSAIFGSIKDPLQHDAYN